MIGGCIRESQNICVKYWIYISHLDKYIYFNYIKNYSSTQSNVHLFQVIFFFFLQNAFVSFDLFLDRKCKTKNPFQSGGDVVFEVIHGYNAQIKF